MIDSTFNRELSLLFRSSVLCEIAKQGSSLFMDYVLHKSGFAATLHRDRTLKEVFEAVYRHLLNSYRAEYVYKNAIATQLMLDKHSLDDTVLINEFNVCSSKADVVILNGTSTVYEIKTSLDNFERLPTQMADYLRVFDYTYLVTDEVTAQKAAGLLPHEVGVIIFGDNCKLSVSKEGISNKENVVASDSFNVLRQSEYKEAVLRQFGSVPEVPNTRIYSECLALFKQLSSVEAHDLMLEALRERHLKPDMQRFVNDMPPSLKSLGLTSKMPKKLRSGLMEALG